jgi:hypothetical protein
VTQRRQQTTYQPPAVVVDTANLVFGYLGCAEGVYPEAILLGQRETGDDVAWSGMVKVKVHVGCACGVKHGRLWTTEAGTGTGTGWVGFARSALQGPEADLSHCRSCRLARSSHISNVYRARSTGFGSQSSPIRVPWFLSFVFRSRARRRAAVCLAYLEA